MADKKNFTKTNEQITETGVSSVVLVKNSKGVNITVKVYDIDPIAAKDKAVKLFDDLEEKYNTGVQN